jgi:hypothetical protein
MIQYIAVGPAGTLQGTFKFSLLLEQLEADLSQDNTNSTQSSFLA